MTLAELREKLARLLKQARDALEEITDDMDESRVAELEARHDEIMAEHDKLEAQYQRQKRIEDAEAREAERQEELDDRSARGADTDGERGGADDDDRMSYRDAFAEMCRCQGNVALMSPEARGVLEAGFQDMSSEHRAQTTTNAAGGYTVPETMLEEIIVSMVAHGPMYDDNGPFRVITTTGGNPMPFPTVDDTTVTAEDSAGEGVTLTDDGGKDITFGTKQLDAYARDTEWLRVSKELADDSFEALEAFIGGLLGERLARKANSDLTVGTGSSAPHGIATAAGAGVTAASATAFTFDEVIDLEHSVNPAYRVGPNVGFMMHDNILKVVRKLKDGDGNYLWTQGNVRAGIPNTINGRQYWINQDMANAVATGNRTILFGDMSKYFVRKVGSVLIGAIQDKDFWPGFGMAGYIRFDGELSDAAAVKRLTQA